jgi:hypothetical protein
MSGNKSLMEAMRERDEQKKRQTREALPEAAGPDGNGEAGAADAGAAPSGDGEAVGETGEGPFNAAAYGFFRGRSEWAAFLEFQPRAGEWFGASYADLRRTRWAASGSGNGPGAMFVLEYADGLKITVRGRNTRAILESIQRQRVFRISEMGEDADRFVPEDAIVVYAIAIAEPQGAAE